MENEVFEHELAAKIKRLRKEANISEEEMAEIIGYHSKVVSAIEAGQRAIGIKTLLKWAQAVGKKLTIDFV
ncbi:helix-turn-helix domain-containing protein [Dyadobacter bucti]|uniref:helix-turn-helix domain-containing protein n=1 Tax=Dyadobacter bucti TaxID=2572203 RepID=UPI0011083067|nr:helix-turn-helix transcriptional regulator [Dyadobacter bucti]